MILSVNMVKQPPYLPYHQTCARNAKIAPSCLAFITWACANRCKTFNDFAKTIPLRINKNATMSLRCNNSKLFVSPENYLRKSFLQKNNNGFKISLGPFFIFLPKNNPTALRTYFHTEEMHSNVCYIHIYLNTTHQTVFLHICCVM